MVDSGTKSPSWQLVIRLDYEEKVRRLVSKSDVDGLEQLIQDRKNQPELLNYIVTNAARVAAQVTSPRTIELLLNRGYVAPDIILHHAAEYSKVQLLPQLSDRFQSYLKTVSRRDLAFHAHTAITRGNIEIMKFLIEQGADVHFMEDALLRHAVEYNQLDIVQYLVQHKADIHVLNDWCLYKAIELDYVDIVEYLIQNGADCRRVPSRIIIQTVLNGYLECMRLLLKHNIDVNAHQGEALVVAAETGNLEIARLLIDHGATRMSRALVVAAQHGDLRMVKLLMDRGARKSSEDDFDRAVKYALKNGHDTVWRFLMNDGVYRCSCINCINGPI